MLRAIPNWRKRYGTVAAYIVDIYPPSEDGIDRRLAAGLDALFVSYGQVQARIQEALNVPTYFVPQAADVLGTGGFQADKRIDVAAFGRQPPGVLESVITAFSSPESREVAWWSQKTTPYTTAMRQDRAGFLALLRRSRISLCYRYEDSNAHAFRGVSPITARWFEASAAGCVVAGSRPSSPEGTGTLDWPDAVLPLPTDGDACVDQLREMLRDPENLLEIGRRNFSAAARAHDWRHRVASIFSALSIEQTPRLSEELCRLEMWSRIR
jgi:hypothetical protein